MILSGACGGLQLTVSLAYRKVYYSLHAGSKNSLDPSVVLVAFGGMPTADSSVRVQSRTTDRWVRSGLLKLKLRWDRYW